MRLELFTKGTPQRSPVLYLPQEDPLVFNWEEGPHQNLTMSTLGLRLPVSRTVGIKLLWLTSDPDNDVL